MGTECNQSVFGFHPLTQGEMRAQFDGEKCIGILQQFAAYFTDHRNADLIEHTVQS